TVRFAAICALLLRRLAVCEERAAAQRAIEGRPAAALRQLLLEPVERAELAAQVVDHVDERGLARARDDRRAVLERAVVAEDDVEHGGGELLREPRELLDQAPDP